MACLSSGLLMMGSRNFLRVQSRSCRAFVYPLSFEHFKCFHTNMQVVNKSDPYKTLGLEWGATTDEIKASYRKLALKYHPDVGQERDAEQFARIQKAYESVMSKDNGLDDGKEQTDEFTFQLWRKGDVIAQKRTDVAGVSRRRPARPVGLSSSTLLDFSGGSVPVDKNARGSDLVGDGSGSSAGRKRVPSTVGTGQSKYFKREYVPWKKEKDGS